MTASRRTGRDAAPSLVDSAEQALQNWLAGGRYRPGDRLPPEQELAVMLGVSRGTLRSALLRLEQSGEIVRRQGSGTFVGPHSLRARSTSGSSDSSPTPRWPRAAG